MNKKEQYVTDIKTYKDSWKVKIPVIKLASYLELIIGADKVGDVKVDVFRNGWSIVCECTREEYRKFMEVAEKYYPKMCRFDKKGLTEGK